MNKNTATLSIFGVNRYHDWAIVFILAVIFLITVGIFTFFFYRGTTAVINGTNETLAVPSTFDTTKTDFESLSAFVKNLESAPHTTVPRNPALR